MKEIDNIVSFQEWLDNGAQPPAAIQNLNIKKFEMRMQRFSFRDSIFFACDITERLAGQIVLSGGWVIPQEENILFDVHRAYLYQPQDLFVGYNSDLDNPYHGTLDYKIYQEYCEEGMEETPSIKTSLLRRLHDHSITDALMEKIQGKKVVAIMGGHGMERQDVYYKKIAEISRLLTQKGYLMISGGGPGAMEATHLGAYFSHQPSEKLNQAIDLLSVRPENAEKAKEYEDSDWLSRAVKVKEELTPEGSKIGESIGIPTWFYGHEPPTIFASHIAKYFANNVREDILLRIAQHGVIFAPGSAGTTQEIFQDAAQNHYAPYNLHHTVKKFVSPMILFGKEHWTNTRPVWDLLQKVSSNRPYGELLHLTEDRESVIEKIVDYDSTQYKY